MIPTTRTCRCGWSRLSGRPRAPGSIPWGPITWAAIIWAGWYTAAAYRCWSVLPACSSPWWSVRWWACRPGFSAARSICWSVFSSRSAWRCPLFWWPSRWSRSSADPCRSWSWSWAVWSGTVLPWYWRPPVNRSVPWTMSRPPKPRAVRSSGLFPEKSCPMPSITWWWWPPWKSAGPSCWRRPFRF